MRPPIYSSILCRRVSACCSNLHAALKCRGRTLSSARRVSPLVVASSWRNPGAMSILADLPRTMARIRRLVREQPNDRELQRLLHTLLTSMSADRIDEKSISTILARVCDARAPQHHPISRHCRSPHTQMEMRCAIPTCTPSSTVGESCTPTAGGGVDRRVDSSGSPQVESLARDAVLVAGTPMSGEFDPDNLWHSAK